MAMEWTDELIAKLRELWGQGLSTAEIGRQLSITKNAVVGKAHRLGLPPRPSPIRNKAAAGTAPRRKSATPRAKKADSAELPFQETSDGPETASPEEPPVREEREAAEKKPTSSASSAAASADTTPKASEAKAAPARATPRKPAARRERPAARPVRQGPTCQWPNGDPGMPGFHFCGAIPLTGKPYCAEHAAIAYVKLRDRRD